MKFCTPTRNQTFVGKIIYPTFGTARRLKTTTVLTFLSFFLGLSACGGGSSNETASEQIEEISPDEESDSAGSVPRVLLAINSPARTRLDIVTVSEQAVTVTGSTQLQTVSSTMAVDVTLDGSSDEFQLNAIPDLQTLMPETLELSSLTQFRVEQRLNSRGVRIESTQQRDIYDELTLDAFTLPPFSLSVPSTPVGVGAIWTERNSQPLLDSTTTTTLQAINGDSITVSKQIEVGNDDQGRYTVEASMEADYSLSSLLMKSADITLTVRFEDELYVNGVLQPVIDNRTYTQTIREVSQ